jgi:hypothetical protein
MAIDTRVPIRPDGLLSRLQRAVIAAGGEWVGAQESIPPAPSVVLFRNPTTGIVLTIPIPMDLYGAFSDTDFSIAVYKLIEADGEKYLNRKIVIPVATLQEISQSLEHILTRLTTIQGGKS